PGSEHRLDPTRSRRYLRSLARNFPEKVKRQRAVLLKQRLGSFLQTCFSPRIFRMWMRLTDTPVRKLCSITVASNLKRTRDFWQSEAAGQKPYYCAVMAYVPNRFENLVRFPRS